jgi:hypothetical protein
VTLVAGKWVGEWRPLDAYPPLPYRGEDGRAVLRAEACACGGTVVRLSGEDDTSAVRRHNVAEPHWSWRLRMQGLDGGPTAGDGARDVSAARPARPAPVQRWRRG